MSAHERSGWRDPWLSARHRLWGTNCPMTDLDGLEYDGMKSVALVEYKHYLANPAHTIGANRKALVDLANRAGLPVIGCRYTTGVHPWSILGLNPLSRPYVSTDHPSPVSELELVTLLYALRRRRLPVSVRRFLETHGVGSGVVSVVGTNGGGGPSIETNRVSRAELAQMLTADEIFGNGGLREAAQKVRR